ncbi:hypothetical protein UY3_03771 [Chelonia mydas]|uniref:Uncharacterized protein n=1 Tax=Chelonia mydas TaxID=8469 RepID=M7CE10_CHEMY|nr:hypothetical protein UY3_03771 [Chelonia mydas]
MCLPELGASVLWGVPAGAWDFSPAAAEAPGPSSLLGSSPYPTALLQGRSPALPRKSVLFDNAQVVPSPESISIFPGEKSIGRWSLGWISPERRVLVEKESDWNVALDQTELCPSVKGIGQRIQSSCSKPFQRALPPGFDWHEWLLLIRRQNASDVQVKRAGPDRDNLTPAALRTQT